MKLLLTALTVLLISLEIQAIYGPEEKTSSPGFHRRKTTKLRDHTGYKLPGNARPKSYDLTVTLTPNSYTIDGEVLITLDVDTTDTIDKTKKLQLNAALDFNTEVEPTFVWNDAMNCSLSTFGAEFIEIECPESIEGTDQKLRITYTATYASDNDYGIYNIYYRENGVDKNMVATQFEQDYARKLFPCFDEPEYKAPITLTLKTDVSNGDWSHWITNTQVASEGRDGNVITTTFEPTPNMSTYLLAIVATTDFKNYSNSESNTDYSFEIFARPSAENYLSIALDSGPKLIDLMGTFNGITYPTLGDNRMVFALLPEFAAGAMENWGLITFKEQLVIDEGTATNSRDKQKIITVIAHELAHQWFGDYVTLDWWSETWLNEGFATYFEYYFPDQLNKDFGMLEQFVVTTKQPALQADSYPDAIPLSNNASEVTTNSDFGAEFNDISYFKGASIVKILHKTLGDDAFKTGLDLYLKNNNYSNPTAKILINTLQSALPEDTKIDLNALFNEWIYENGYPLLDVSVDEKNKVTITASKFTTSANKTQETITNWWIPLTHTTSENPDFDTISFEWTRTADLANYSVSLPDKNDSWIIFNLQSIGFYRVNYDQVLWDRIIAVLNNSTTYTTINVLNRAQLLDDIFNIAKSYQSTEDNGTLYYATAFRLMEYLQYETEYYPWYTFFTEMQYLMEVIQDNHTMEALKEKILNVVVPQLAFPKDGDNSSHTETLKRSLLLTWACRLGYDKCLTWANQQYQNYKNSTSSIDNNYRDLIVCNGLALTTNTTRKEYKLILGYMESSNLPFEQADLLRALTCISSNELVNELLLQTIDFIPNEPKFSRIYNDGIITTLMASGFEKLKCALYFALTYDNSITQYWQGIEDPETLFKKIATKIYNQKHVDMINEYIEKNKNEAEYAARIVAAKEAIEIANENIAYLNEYSAILKYVIYGTDPEPTTETPSPGGSMRISSNLFLATVFAFLLKYMLC